MNIRRDERQIEQILLMDYAYTKDVNGVEKIVPYEEYGEMASVTWYEVWVDGRLESRVNGKYVVEVRYSRQCGGI